MYSDIISSVKNPFVKHIKKLLTSGKYRREKSLAVAEGVHLCQSLLRAEIVPNTVVYSESGLKNAEVSELQPRLDQPGVSVLTLKDSLFESISDIHATVGVLVVFDPHPADEVLLLASRSLFLENIQDPGNLGTILRTAAAAGVRSVRLSSGSASAWSPKALRAGMGAQFGLDIAEDVDLAELIRATTLPVLATDLAATNSIYDADLSGESIWLFGNEGQGVSPKLLALCTQRVTIPQADSTVESLNVSAAVAVCLFEQRRQKAAHQ